MSRSELADGWCENCGKKLPTAVTVSRAASRDSTAAVSKADEPMPVWAKVALLLLGLFLVYTVVAACAGDAQSTRYLIKIGGMVVAGVVIGMVGFVVRKLRG
jgi:hypothetical protein